MLQAGVLDAIHLYADGVDRFAGFPGSAARLVRRGREDTGSAVEALDEPTSKGDEFVFVQYDALGVKLTWAADWETPDAHVRCVSLWST